MLQAEEMPTGWDDGEIPYHKKCANPGCLKWIHLECFQVSVMLKGTDKQRDFARLKEDEVVCTVACYSKVKPKVVLYWNNDGKNGEDDP